ncbi:MAG: UDP-N-acetylmuramate--L-alanine ligase [Nitrospirae bacterium]|nr:UDP-N-acetylmuramate--L-alanine ligase [Nitrospirota bacterium]
MFKKIQHIHFVGIGGAGMSGIAEVLLNLGYRVSGSDLQESETVQRLRRLGGTIAIGHRESHIEGAQVVVISSAVAPGNPEVRAARKRLVPVIPRAEMLAELMRLKYGVAIAGAHGKTTTTSLTAGVLAQGGLDPTVVIGGKLNRFGSNAKLGQGEFLVAEADESDGSFLKLSPTLAVVTNMDMEHLDYYGGMSRIQETFLSFINKVPFYGLAILCLDEERIQEIIPRVEKRYLTYGMVTQADLIARDVRLESGRSSFQVTFRGEPLGRFELPLPGIHNVNNALAAIGVALELEIPMKAVEAGLREFSGVERRFQVVGEGKREDVLVVDDYGHHPTEIKATLAAAKSGWNRRTVVIFQPHRYTRTRDLLEEFGRAFYQADVLILTDIYAAGEKPIEGVTSEGLYETILRHGHRSAFWIPDKKEIPDFVRKTLLPGDMVITLVAGDIWKIGREIAEGLA